MKQTLETLVIFIALMMLNSCTSSSSLDWDVDVYTKIRKDGNDTLYALTAYAYSYQNIANVTLDVPAYTNEEDEYIQSKTLLMSKFVGQDKSWILPTNNGSYVKEFPVIGTYQFSATNVDDSSSGVKENTLGQSIVLPTEIYTIVYDAENNSYKLTWNWMTSAANYRAYVYKGDVMLSQSSLSRDPNGVITLTDGKGYNNVEVNNGDAVMFEIVGNVYESASSTRLQSQASMTYNLNWGESYTSPSAPAASSSAATTSSAR
ncbi:hypothetical protein K5X82_09785 [Halosquirtibacter xylanolyticus]|uniref:hypothetical protein n=1 Tax=Halosquirtibacter xylanolyticus TaxID=3374599 RepID=UPI003748174E|nr:hypothetical protein K5X82_09785 [Prolixibacteraceae bacterium]